MQQIGVMSGAKANAASFPNATAAWTECLQNFQKALENLQQQPLEPFQQQEVQMALEFCDSAFTGGMSTSDLAAMIAACWKLKTSGKADDVCSKFLDLYRSCAPQSTQAQQSSSLRDALKRANTAVTQIQNVLKGPCALLCAVVDQDLTTALESAGKNLGEASQAVSSLLSPCSGLEEPAAPLPAKTYRTLTTDYLSVECESAAIEPLMQPLARIAIQSSLADWSQALYDAGALIQSQPAPRNAQNEIEQEFAKLRRQLGLIEGEVKNYESGNCGKSTTHLRSIVQRLMSDVDEGIAWVRENGNHKKPQREALARYSKALGSIRSGFAELGQCGSEISGINDLFKHIPAVYLKISAALPDVEAQPVEPEEAHQIQFTDFSPEEQISVRIFSEGVFLEEVPVSAFRKLSYRAKRGQKLEMHAMSDGKTVDVFSMNS